MKAASAADLAANPSDPQPENVIVVNVPHGESVTGDLIDRTLAEHRPMWAVMTHWETGSGRINDLAGFNAACARHHVMGIVDAVSSLGVGDFNIDDYAAVVAWASCPQKGVLSLPLTYAPVSFRDSAIAMIARRGCRSFVHHPILEARHWGILEGRDVETAVYHRTHSCYAVAALHEALRILLTHGKAQKAADYRTHEAALRTAVSAMGCKVTSNMTSLIVLDLPDALTGQEKTLVNNCRAQNFGIWTTLSEPMQIRIGILNQLNQAAITDIASRFADALLAIGGDFDKATVMAALNAHYAAAQ